MILPSNSPQPELRANMGTGIHVGDVSIRIEERHLLAHKRNCGFRPGAERRGAIASIKSVMISSPFRRVATPRRESEHPYCTPGHPAQRTT
jgi:hypothetical protein